MAKLIIAVQEPFVLSKLRQTIRAGDIVMCDEGLQGYITREAVYKVKTIDIDGDRILLNDDNGNIGLFKANRFIRMVEVL